MKMRKTAALMLCMALPIAYWQCTGTSGKEKEEGPVAGNIRQFNTKVVQPADVDYSLNITGRVVPLQKIEIIAEVQGTALPTPKPLKEGLVFKKGEVLVSIDDADSRYNLSAQKSQFLNAMVRIMSDLKLDYPGHFDVWNEYLSSVNVDQPLPKLPEVADTQLRYFLAANDVFNRYYSIKSQEETLKDFKIYAPFTGAVTQANLDPGNLVSPGAKLGEFIRTDRYEVQAAVSVGDIHLIKPGQVIELTSKTVQGKWQGTVSRIGKSVNASTQSVSVYLLAKGSDLKEGMYLEGKFASHTYQDAVEIPKDILTRKNQVHVIEDSTVKLKNVSPIEFRESTVIVHGLAAGDRLITDIAQAPIQGLKAISR